jgi:hypothetical protein
MEAARFGVSALDQSPYSKAASVRRGRWTKPNFNAFFEFARIERTAVRQGRGQDCPALSFGRGGTLQKSAERQKRGRGAAETDRPRRYIHARGATLERVRGGTPRRAIITIVEIESAAPFSGVATGRHQA